MIQKNGPERLTTLSSEQLLAVRGETAIVLKQDSSSVVEAQPIFGGRPSELLRQPNTTLGYAVRADKLFYAQPKDSSSDGVDFNSVSISSKNFSRPVLLATLSGVKDYKLLLKNDFAFWIHPTPLPKEIGSKGLSASESESFDLMALPLSGGKAECSLKRMKDAGAFSGGNSGVFWFKPSSKPYSLHYWRAGLEHIYPDFDALETSLVDTTNRLYWIQKSQAAKTLLELHARFGGPMPPDLGTLTSVKLDGTDRQTIANVNLNSNGFASQLTSYRDRLYLWKRPLDFRSNSMGSMKDCGLWRLKNESSFEFERLFASPQGAGKGFCFDGNYFYFVREEAQDGLFGWDDSRPTIHTLYRYRLPN